MLDLKTGSDINLFPIALGLSSFGTPIRSMNNAFKTSTCVIKNSRFKYFREKQHFIVLKNTFLYHSPGMSDKRLA